MSTSTHMRVSDEDRNAAVTTIQAAYAEGRLDEPNLERRLDLALNARTRLELDQALDGLARPRPQIPFSAPAMPLVHQTLTSSALRRHADGPASGLTHLSALPFGPFGPGAVWLFAGQGTAVKREAAKALNFQVIAWVIGAVLGVTAFVLNTGFFAGIWGLAWFVLTVASGVKAWQGEDWENPVTHVVGKRIVDEGHRRH